MPTSAAPTPPDRSAVLDHPSVRRVLSALSEAGVTGEVVVLDGAARTAAQAAEALGTAVSAIANSLVFVATLSDGSQIPLLVLTSGGHRVETDHLAHEQGLSSVRRADADFVRARTGFAIGGVPPLGHTRRVLTLVDAALADHAVVWAAAGHPHAVFPTSYEELLRITGGRSVRVRPAP